MSNDKIIIIIFACLYFLLILFTRRKSDFEEYSVAGRGLGLFLIFASLSASYIGPAMTLGLSRNGFKNGFFLCFIAIFSGIALIVVAQLIAPKIRSKFTQSLSIGDIIGGTKSHNHKSVQFFSGVISFCLMTAICIAMSYAGGELINNVFGFPKTISILIITSIVIVYSFFGGIRATIQTDVIQFLHFIILIPVLAILLISSESFNATEFYSYALKDTHAAIEIQTATGIFGMILFWFLSSGFDSIVINRFLASKNESIAKKATSFAGLFMILWAIVMVSLGAVGKYLHPELADNDQVLLQMASLHFPDFLYGIFIVAMIGIVMSSQDSALNSASVIFSEDLVKTIKSDIGDKAKLRYSKIVTIIIGLLSIIIAGYISSILDAIVAIFSMYIPIIIPILIFSIYKKQHNWQSGITAMGTGLIFYIIWNLSGYKEVVPSILVALILSIISYLVVDRIVGSSKIIEE